MKHTIVACLLAMVCSAGVAQSDLGGSRQILVFGDSSFSTYGRLLSVSGDTLRLLTTLGRQAILRQDVRRIIVRSDSPHDTGVRYGLVIGGYASLYLLGTDNETGTFLHSRLAKETGVVFLALVPGMAVGAAVGYLVDRRSGGSEQVFDLTNHPGAWEALVKALGPPDPGTLHVSVQLSQVSGQEFDDPSFGGWVSENMASRFNLARKIQCTYSVTPEIELGLAVTPTGTLRVSRYKFDYPTARQTRSYSMDRSLKLTGYFAAGQYSLFRASLPAGMELKVGGGIGIMRVQYARTTGANFSTYDSLQTSITTIGPLTYALSHAELSGFISAEWSIRVSDGLSLGLVADRLFVRNITDPGEPAFPTRSTEATLSSWGLGFQLGVHF